MDAFIQGLARKDFKEALGHKKSASMTNLIKIATEWADGEDSVQGSRASPPCHSHDSGSQSRRDSYRYDRRRKRLKRHYDDDRPEFIAAGYAQTHDDQERSNRRSDDRRDSRDREQRNSSYKRQDWQKSHSSSERSFEDKMDDYCRLHLFKGDDGRLRSSHSLKECKEFDQLALR